MTDRALVDSAHWWLHTMHTHVGFEIALGGEGSAADLTAEGSFTGVRSIVHEQSAATGEDLMTDNAFIWICDFILDVVDKLLKLRGFRRTIHFDVAFPRVIRASRSWHHRGEYFDFAMMVVVFVMVMMLMVIHRRKMGIAIASRSNATR